LFTYDEPTNVHLEVYSITLYYYSSPTRFGHHCDHRHCTL